MAIIIPTFFIKAGVVLVILALAGSFVRSPFFKGWLGEWLVNMQMKLFLNKRDYHLLRNVTLPCEDGTTQIDHVIVSRFGIFVIETKNMQGWIFGSEREATWTQKFRNSSRTFQNPLRQNYKHVAVLAESLGLPVETFKSVIIFIGDATLKTSMPPNVMNRGQVTFIKSHRNAVLTEEQVGLALANIESMRLTPGIRTHVQHVRNVRAIVSQKMEAIEAATNQSETLVAPAAAEPQTSVAMAPEAGPPLCPKCGRSMAQRVARSGDRAGKSFWGCTGYPNCRGIRNI